MVINLTWNHTKPQFRKKILWDLKIHIFSYKMAYVLFNLMHFSWNGRHLNFLFDNQKNFQKFFFKNFKISWYLTVISNYLNCVFHEISHPITYKLTFWDPEIGLLRLLRCASKRHFVWKKEHSAPPWNMYETGDVTTGH